MTTIVRRDLSALKDAVLAALAPTYELTYVHHDEELTGEQAAMLVRGEWDELADAITEVREDGRYDACVTIIRDLAEEVTRDWEREDDPDGTDAPYPDYSAVCDELTLGCCDEFDEVRSAIEERDVSDPVRSLIRNTGLWLLRVTAVDEDHAWSFETVEPTTVLSTVGLAATEHNVRTVADALANASPEFSVLMGYWVFSVDLEALYDLPAGTTMIDVTDPHLYLGNPFAGSGFVTDEPLHGSVRLNVSDLRTDRDAFGHSLDAVYGGLNESAFEATITPVR